MRNPILKKLLLKDQDPLLILNAPQEYHPVIDSITAIVDTAPKGTYEWIQTFVKNESDVAKLVPQAVKALGGQGALLWICYPKKSSRRYKTTINRDQGWEIFGNLGFEPVTQVAIDEDWSALRFRRVEEIKTLTRKFALTAEGRRRTRT